MPWTNTASTTIPVTDDGEYVKILLTGSGTFLLSGVSIEPVSGAQFTRRRVGFLYPMGTVDSRILVGPCEEMTPGIPGGTPAIHRITFAFLGDIPALGSRITEFGALVAPERGFYPAIVRVWRLT